MPPSRSALRRPRTPEATTVASPYSSVTTSRRDFDDFERLEPVRIVPSHGAVGGASLIVEQRAVLKAIQERALALKRDGKTADEAARIVQTELQAPHPDWTGPAQAGSAARTAFNETR